MRGFQSTLPVWGGTRECGLRYEILQTISIHPPRVGRDQIVINFRLLLGISIHPPRVGRDTLTYPATDNNIMISIHPPRVGRDILLLLSELGSGYFNPPSPCGEGRKPSVTLTLGRYFNPPSPCGEGLKAQRDLDLGQIFQSTLPVWGGTRGNSGQGGHRAYFNPPSPCGEGLPQNKVVYIIMHISIHPPRVGRDPFSVVLAL